MSKFAKFNNVYYHESTSVKSGVGIRTPYFDKRHLSCFVYGGLLRAAHVAGRFFCRGSSNPEQATTNSFEPISGGIKNNETKGTSMSSRFINVLLRFFDKPCTKAYLSPFSSSPIFVLMAVNTRKFTAISYFFGEK